MKTNCIICKREVENWDEAYPEDKPQIHPIDGTVFRTYGHYGSSVFDPMDASYLEVVFCDPCLKELMESGVVYKGLNGRYAAELEEQRKEQEEWLAEVWKKNEERNKCLEKS